MKIIALLLVLTALALPTAVAAETVDNPVYVSWAKFGVGTQAVYRSVSDAAGQKTESTVTYKLAEKTPEKAVIEMSTTMTVGGQKIETPVTKMEQVAKIEKVEPPQTEAKPADVKSAEEKVKTGGGEFACKVTEVKLDANGMEGVSKTWMSDEVPGMLVKSSTTTVKPVAAETTIELLSLDKK